MDYLAYALITDRQVPGRVIAGLANGEVWHTADNGDSWARLPLNLGRVYYMMIIVQDRGRGPTGRRGQTMDLAAYRRAYYVEPVPEPRFRFKGSFGATLYFEDYRGAVAFYARVLGPPAYVEGEGTRGWPIGGGWLTLLQGCRGNPRNIEITLELDTAEQAEALQRAFIEAGASGPAPSDQLMYQAVRSCPVVDPFGLEIMIIGPLTPGGSGTPKSA